jgi:hypothetical protein
VVAWTEKVAVETPALRCNTCKGKLPDDERRKRCFWISPHGEQLESPAPLEHEANGVRDEPEGNLHCGPDRAHLAARTWQDVVGDLYGHGHVLENRLKTLRKQGRVAVRPRSKNDYNSMLPPSVTAKFDQTEDDI